MVTKIPGSSPSGAKKGSEGGGMEEARKCVVQVVRVSGTIRKAEEEAIRRGRQAILRAKGEDAATKFFGETSQGAKTGGVQRQLVDIEDDDEDVEMEDDSDGI